MKKESATLDISVVIPVYGCASCLHELYTRLTNVLAKLGKSYEIILVDDYSMDAAWPKIQALASQDFQHVKGIQLSRNYGQHLAITAGLAETVGEHVVVMDCDLQEPPEEIPTLFNFAQKGYDIVYSVRKVRQDTFFRRALALAYVTMMDFLTGQKIDRRRSNFTVISRPVVEGFLRFGDCNRHYLYILYWMGFRSIDVEYWHAGRFSGKSSYTFLKLIKHSLSGVFFHTNRFLYGIIFFGIAIAFAGLCLAAYYVFRYLIASALPGWTSLAVLILCTSGFLGFSVGVCGLYIGEIFAQVKGRPLYIVGRRTNNIASKELVLEKTTSFGAHVE